MGYTKLLEPFIIQFEQNNVEYQATVTYVKSDSSGVNFFDVTVTKPQGIDPFYLREKR